MHKAPDYDKIKKLEKELEEERKKAQSLEDLDPRYKLAIMLHETFCGFNHTDGCGWYYEAKNGGADDWGGREHTRWLVEANSFVNKCNILRNAIAKKTGFELAFTVLENFPSVSRF